MSRQMIDQLMTKCRAQEDTIHDLKQNRLRYVDLANQGAALVEKQQKVICELQYRLSVAVQAVGELAAGLEPFAQVADEWDELQITTDRCYIGDFVTLPREHFQLARDLLRAVRGQVAPESPQDPETGVD